MLTNRTSTFLAAFIGGCLLLLSWTACSVAAGFSAKDAGESSRAAARSAMEQGKPCQQKPEPVLDSKGVSPDKPEEPLKQNTDEAAVERSTPRTRPSPPPTPPPHPPSPPLTPPPRLQGAGPSPTPCLPHPPIRPDGRLPPQLKHPGPCECPRCGRNTLFRMRKEAAQPRNNNKKTMTSTIAAAS